MYFIVLKEIVYLTIPRNLSILATQNAWVSCNTQPWASKIQMQIENLIDTHRLVGYVMSDVFVILVQRGMNINFITI